MVEKAEAIFWAFCNWDLGRGAGWDSHCGIAGMLQAVPSGRAVPIRVVVQPANPAQGLLSRISRISGARVTVPDSPDFRTGKNDVERPGSGAENVAN